MPRTEGLVAERLRITFHELSLLPSSMKMASYRKRFAVITRSIHAASSGSDSLSFSRG